MTYQRNNRGRSGGSDSSGAVALLQTSIDGARQAFELCKVEKSLNFESEARFALQALIKSDFTMSVARSNPASLISAVSNISAIGLSLNPATAHAYLVPRKIGDDFAICLDISYKGLVHLAVQGGAVIFAQAKVVRENDVFELNGVAQEPTHKFKPFARDRGEVIGVYAVAKLASGDFMTEFMSVDDVNRIRDRSDAFIAYRAKKIKSTPWASDWDEMAKKTVTKRANKSWPKTERMDHAIHYLNTEGGEGLADISDAQSTQPKGGAGGATFDADAFIKRAQVSHTEPALMAVYREAMAAAAAAKDRPGAERFKTVALKRRDDIRNNTIDMEQAA